MPPSRNPRRYADVQHILDIALSTGECKVQFTSPSLAKSMANRIYTFQAIMMELDPLTPYTGYKVRLVGDTITILPYTVESAGGTILTPHDPKTIQPPVPNVPDSPLAMAEALLRNLPTTGETPEEE